jgi:hypothetical protein
VDDTTNGRNRNLLETAGKKEERKDQDNAGDGIRKSHGVNIPKMKVFPKSQERPVRRKIL